MRKEKIRVGSLESKVTKLLQIRGIKEADPLYTAIFKMLADVGERKRMLRGVSRCWILRLSNK